MEEELLEAQMQEVFDIDHAEAAVIDEPGGQNPFRVEHELSQSAREPKLIIGRFGCIAGSLMQNTSLSFVRRSMLRVSRRTTALILASCRTVNWWLTAGSVEGSIVAGLNVGSPTSGDKSLQHRTGSSVLVGVCRRWRLINRVLKWMQAVCLAMSGPRTRGTVVEEISKAWSPSRANGQLHLELGAPSDAVCEAEASVVRWRKSWLAAARMDGVHGKGHRRLWRCGSGQG